MSLSQDFDLNAELKKCKTADDIAGKDGLLQRLVEERSSNFCKMKWMSI
ncbi:MAG: hypothetical protein H0X29_11725 [Parachlamydiaceae bacterium]|nr:hypothetical protein [Parachlamydiaceae bacterium]